MGARDDTTAPDAGIKQLERRGIAGGFADVDQPAGHADGLQKTVSSSRTSSSSSAFISLWNVAGSAAWMTAPPARDAPDGEHGMDGNGRPHENADEPHIGAGVCENRAGGDVVQEQRRNQPA